MGAGYEIGSPDPMSPLNSPGRLLMADRATTALNALAMQEGQQKVELQGMALDDARREQDFWKNREGSGAAGPNGFPSTQTGQAAPASPGMQLMQLGQEMLGKGIVKPGLLALEKGSTLLSHEAEIRSKNATAQKAQVEMLGNLAGAVTDQDSYDNFRMYLKGQGLANTAGMPEDYVTAAPMIRQMAESSISAAKRLEASQRGLRDEVQAANVNSLIQHRKVMENIAARREKLAEDRLEGKADKELSVSANERTQAARLIRSTLFPTAKAGGTSEDEVLLQNAINAGADSVAAEAKKITRQNRGISYPEALNQALAQSKKNGDWDTVKSYEHSILGFKWGEKQQQRFKGPKPLAADTVPVAGQLYEHGGKTYMGTEDGQLIEDSGSEEGEEE